MTRREFLSDHQVHHPFGPSSLPRLYLCPGSHAMSEGIPLKKDSREASRGRLLHAAVTTKPEDMPYFLASVHGEDGKPVELTDQEAEAVGLCREYAARICESADEIEDEKYLELYDERSLKISHGWADRVAFWEKSGRVVVIDWKFYRSELPPEAVLCQGAALGAMAMQEYYAKEAYVGFYLPFERREYHFSITGAELEKAIEKIKAIIAVTKSRKVILNPSEHACRYCRALAYCPAVRRALVDVAKPILFPTFPAIKAEVEREVAKLPAETVLGNIGTAKLANLAADALLARAKELILAGKESPDWEVKSKRGNRQIMDAWAAYEALSPEISQKQVLDAMTVQVGKLEKIYVAAKAEADGIAKKKAREIFEARLGTALTRGPDKHELRRRK